MQTPETHTSREIAQAMVDRAFARRYSIWRSLYAPVLELSHARNEHPGYEDFILTRAHRNDIATAPARVAYLNARHGVGNA